MRRQIGEAIRDLQQAEQLTPELTPELTHAQHGARLVTRDLLQLSGLRPRPNSAISRSDSESCAS